MKRTGLFLIVLLLAALITTYSFPVAADSTIGTWGFNEGSGAIANDSSGNGLTGYLSDISMWNSGSVSGASLYFNGSNSVSVSGSSLLNFAANQNFTIEAWVYVPAALNRWQAVISSGRYNYSTAWYGIWISNDNRWVIGAAGNNIYGCNVTTGAWHHIAVVQDGVALTRYLYVDAYLAASGPSANGITNSPLIFGAAGTGENFTGYLDEITIKDYMVDPYIIACDYTRYVHKQIGFWKFEEPWQYPGNTADSSGHNFDGIRSGGSYLGYQPAPAGSCVYFYRGGDIFVWANYLFNFSRYDNFTISAWVNLSDEFFNNQWNGVITKGRETSQWYGLWISPDKKWVFGSQNGNIVGSSVTPGWHYIYLVQSGYYQTRYLYVDSVFQASGPSADALTNANLIFGDSRSPYNGGYYELYAGWLDEVSIYNYAFTP
jgi:hypothetical protein